MGKSAARARESRNFPTRHEKSRAMGQSPGACNRWKGCGIPEICIANGGKIEENVPVFYFTNLNYRMKLGYFIGGTSALLLGWLTLTFVSATPPASEHRSGKPRAAENRRTPPGEAGIPVADDGRIFPISLSQ